MNFLRNVGWLNLLLVFVPVAMYLEWTHGSPVAIFVTSGIAIIPLAGLMGHGTEVLAARLGPGIGGLLNASFGNAAELIIAFFALRAGKLEVVKASITGSILGNVLLVLGASLLAGGVKFERQRFNATAAGVGSTMLALAAVGLLVPAVFDMSVRHEHKIEIEQDVSLEISIVLFVAYVLMLLFSLRTHRHLYEGAGDDAHAAGAAHAVGGAPPGHAAGGAAHDRGHWPLWVAVTVLLGATALVALMSEFLVGVLEHAQEQFGWTDVFVGVVVIAIVGNAAEHSTAILVAMKNQMDLSIQIAVGSGMQIALFVAPALVFLSYLPGFEPLNLLFTPLEVAAVAASVFVVGLVAHDGESNWLEGLLLLAVYAVLAIAFYNVPEMAHAAAASP